MSDTPKPAAGAARSPFAHRATNAPAPRPEAPVAPAAVSPAAPAGAMPAKPAGFPVVPVAIAVAALAGVAGYLAWGDSSPAATPGQPAAAALPAAVPMTPAERLVRAEKASAEALRLVARPGFGKPDAEAYGRALARLSEAKTQVAAGRPAEATSAHEAAVAALSGPLLASARAEYDKAVAAGGLRAARDFRADLWRAHDARLDEAAMAERAGDGVRAAALVAAVTDGLPALASGVAGQLRTLAGDAEARGDMPAARVFRRKSARLEPADAVNHAWLMRHGHATGDIVRDALGIPFAYLTPGSFTQGSPEAEAGREADEARRKVTLTKGFYLGVTEVTQAQWDAVMGVGAAAERLAGESRRFVGADRPMVDVTWPEAVDFCRRISARTGLSYRLPTEAEWEYACRAGTEGPYSAGKLFLSTADAAVDDGTATAPDAPRPAGSIGVANAWGLRDMHGNVWEWCADWYGPRAAAPVTDPAGPLDKDAGRADLAMKVARGGSWNDPANAARAANRWSYTPGVRVNYIGFRLLLEFSPTIE